MKVEANELEINKESENQSASDRQMMLMDVCVLGRVHVIVYVSG